MLHRHDHGRLGRIVAGAPITLRISDACATSGLSRSTIYRLLWSGELESVSIGRRRLVVAASLERLLSKGAETAGATKAECSSAEPA